MVSAIMVPEEMIVISLYCGLQHLPVYYGTSQLRCLFSASLIARAAFFFGIWQVVKYCGKNQPQVSDPPKHDQFVRYPTWPIPRTHFRLLQGDLVPHRMVRSDVSLGFGDALDTEPKKVRRCAGARKCHGGDSGPCQTKFWWRLVATVATPQNHPQHQVWRPPQSLIAQLDFEGARSFLAGSANINELTCRNFPPLSHKISPASSFLLDCFVCTWQSSQGHLGIMARHAS